MEEERGENQRQQYNTGKRAGTKFSTGKTKSQI